MAPKLSSLQTKEPNLIKPFLRVKVTPANDDPMQIPQLAQALSEIDGKPIYRIVGETVEKWGADYIGASGYSPCGAGAAKLL